MSGDDAYFPGERTPHFRPPHAGDDNSLLREQAYEIIDAVLSGTDPEGAEVRKRLCEHLAAYPGRPEAALQEHLIFTRSLAIRRQRPGHFGVQPGPNGEPCSDAGIADSPPARDRASIESVLSGGMLVTAFQPVFALAKREVVGAEALTRFVSEGGDRANVWFDGAVVAGLDLSLEIAALESAVRSMQQLPRHLYVVLNLSPTTCQDSRLPKLLKQANRDARKIVLELTRNFTSTELDPLVAALEPLRQSGLRLTVNNAGPDAASMRHIRRLRPDFIKLDRSLIVGIERDSGLQALVADMVEFGRLTGTRLIAVGIETADELATVTRLGMTAGQGYFLGRPTINSAEWSSWTGSPRRRIRQVAGVVPPRAGPDG